MIITVIPMWVMKVTIDEVVDVIAVGDRFVSAAGAMNVTVFVTILMVVILAIRRIRFAYWNDMLFHLSVFTLMMEVTVMKVIDVITMLNRSVSAVGSMLMIVIRVGLAGLFAHVKIEGFREEFSKRND